MRILVVSLLAHAIALPILAHFGAFKNIRKSFGDTKVVMFSVPPLENKEKPKEKAKKKADKVAAKKSSGAKSANRSAASNLPQPKVVTSGPAGAGGGGGPAAVSGTGKAGFVPVVPKPTTKGDGGGAGAPVAPPVTNPPKPEPPTPEPLKPELPKSPPPTAPLPKAKRIVEAVAVESPEPTIPDDLRSEPLDKTLIVEADVDTGGHPTRVTVASSTGIPELDQIGLDTARRYRFRPATVDDVPVDQHVRFRILFKVE